MATTQERYIEMLMGRVRNDRYPSGQMMDRIEAALWTSEQLNEYLELLIDKVDQTWYPSRQILDRIQRMMAMVATTA